MRSLVYFAVIAALGLWPAATSAQTPAGVVSVFASAARVASTNSSSFDTAAKGIQLTLDVTAASGSSPTLDVKLQQFDGLSGQWTDVPGATFQRITGTGQRTLTVYPSAQGAGAVRSITGTDQAANTEVSETVPANTRWRIRAFRVALATDVNVANRIVNLQVDDGATVYYVAQANENQPASVTYNYSFGLGGANKVFLTQANDQITLPDLLLLGGHKITTSTGNRQVGDNFAAPQYVVEEWIGNYAGTPLPRTWRAVATIGGGTPSFTFSIGGTYIW